MVVYKGENLGKLSLDLLKDPQLQKCLGYLLLWGYKSPLNNSNMPFKISREYSVDLQLFTMHQLLRKRQKVTLIDDYAHHPVENQLLRCRELCKPILREEKIALFQPHRYSRVQKFKMGDFVVVLMMLMASWFYLCMPGEKEGSHTHEDLYKGILEHSHRNVHYASSLQTQS